VKATFADFLSCTVAIGLLLTAALASVGYVSHPLAVRLIPDYFAIADFLALLFAYGVVSGVAIRLLVAVRALEAGEYAMDSPVFGYWKLLTIVYRLGHAALLPFTPIFLRPLVAWLFGARVGRHVAIGGTIDDPYLVTLGEGAVLGNNSLVAGSMIAGGRFTVGPVRIGAGATVGANAVVLPGTELGDGALLLGGSIVVAGTRIPAGETWRGNPARKWQ
jgi:serine acetyltransferase